jgi:hypothetical protein
VKENNESSRVCRSSLEAGGQGQRRILNRGRQGRKERKFKSWPCHQFIQRTLLKSAYSCLDPKPTELELEQKRKAG